MAANLRSSETGRVHNVVRSRPSNENTVYVVNCIQMEISSHYSIQLQTFNSLQKDLQSYVNTSTNKILPHLDHIIALLHQAIATCIAATKVTKSPEPIDKKENLPPGKCLEHQWRFVKTTKLPGRKRKGNVLR